jgi:acyl-homoserine lactone synthase
VGKDSNVAVIAAFDRRTLARLRETRGDDREVIVARPTHDVRLLA